MVVVSVSIGFRPSDRKKASVVEHPWVFNHAGLLFNGLPGTRRAALHLVIRDGAVSREAQASPHSL